MPLRAYMPRTPGKGFEAQLHDHLGPEVTLATGTTRPDPPDYEVLVTGRPRPADLEEAPRLRLVVIPYAGLAPETRDLLRGHPRLAVHNLHHNAAATAELAVGLLLAAARRILPADRALRHGDWRPRYAPDQGVLLAGREALVLGFGAIGSRVARALRGLGMRVAAVRRRPEAPPRDGERDRSVEVAGPDALEALLPRAHAVVVCVPGTDETRGLLDARRLALLPPDAVLVNVSRGEVVEEDALYRALVQGRLGAAGLDVWYRYPREEEERVHTQPSGLPFFDLDNVVLSPHRAGLVRETEGHRARDLAALLLAAARGEVVPNRIDLDAGY